MKKDVLLSHDIGTTGNKASLYDLDGRLLKSFYYPYETFYPRPGWTEQRPEDWWKAFITCTKEVLAASNIQPGQIAGLSFSGQMMAAIPVNQKGEVLQKNVMIWADHRSHLQGEYIKKTIGWERFYYLTGSGMEIPLYPVAKILWLKENEADVYKKTYKFLGVKDVLINRLTGRFVTDFSDASNTGMLDLKNRKWAKDLIQELGIDFEKLVEEILPSQTVVGKINKEVSEATGLLEGTPVILGGGDVACAALGAGVIEEGSVYNYIGSASWLATATSRPLFNTTMRPFSLCHVVPDMYVVQLAMFSGGVVYEWVRDQICKFECEEAKLANRDPFELMDELAASSPPGSNGIIFLPDLRPGGAPHNNLNARGAFIGLTLSHKRGDLLRSVLEGITFNIRLMCDAMEEALGFPFQEVRMIGGGSNSRLWREIESNVLNKVVVILSAKQEANSLGAAILAGCGLGIFSDFKQAAKVFIRVKESINPNPEVVAVYNRLLPLFDNAYQALAPVNDQLSSLA